MPPPRRRRRRAAARPGRPGRGRSGGRRARQERADADGDHRRARRRRAGATCASASAIAATCASCDGGRDRLEITGSELLGVGADDARQTRADLLGLGPRPSGNVHVHCAAVSSPRSRWASAAIANSSEETGHGPAADRNLRHDRGDVRPQRAGVHELGREQPLDIGPSPRRHVAAGDRDHVGGRAAAVDEDRVGQRAGDQQRGRDPVGGRARQRVGPRLFDLDQRSGRGDHSQRSSRQRRGDRVQHVQHPDALALEHVDELRRRRQRHRRAVEPEPTDDRRDRVRQCPGRAPHLERLGDDPDAAVAVDGRRLRVGASDVESDHGRGGRRDAAMIIPAMRIVPVLDLQGGVVVHARRGDRAGYAPLRSPLVDGCGARRRRAGAVRPRRFRAAVRRRPRCDRRRAGGCRDPAAAGGRRGAVGRRGRDDRRAGGGAGQRRRGPQRDRDRVAVGRRRPTPATGRRRC